MNKVAAVKRPSIIEKPLTVLDYVIFAILAVVCFFSFQHGDILHTAGSSFGYLNGHFFDFYEYNSQFHIYDSYMPSSYMMFAVWNIPLKLLGIVTQPTMNVPLVALMWYKLFPTTLYMISGYIIYKICMEIGMGSKKSKICTYAFYTTPIAFFSQFIFGQYDIFTLFFMLLGIYYYFKGKNNLFILFFAFSIPFKYFSLLVFLPLLLLKEKNVWKVIRSCILVAIPYIVEILIYLPSDIFRDYVFGFGPSGYIFTAVIDTGYFKISWVFLVFALVCAWAYFQKVNGKTEWAQWAFFLCTLVMFACFGLSMWHPQWLLMGMPFFVISAFMHKDTKIFMILDILIMVFFVLFTVNFWDDRVDQFLFSLGIFENVMRDYNVGTKLNMRDLLRFKDKDFIMSAFSSLLLISAVFKHPKFLLRDLSTSIDHCMGWIRARFVIGVSIFVVPAFITLIVALIPPYVTIDTGKAYEGIGPMTPGNVFTQVFIPEKGELEKITFRVGTYGRDNFSTLDVKLVNTYTNEVVASESYMTSLFTDNEWVEFDTNNLLVDLDTEYALIFESEDSNENHVITLYRTANMGLEKNAYALLNGNQMDYQICVKVYENKR